MPEGKTKKTSKKVKRSKSLEALYQAGKSLFYKYGVKKVSVEEICELAQVSKMTFYRKFDNKIKLAGYVIENMSEENFAKYRELMDSSLDYPSKMIEMVRLKSVGTEELSKEFVQDVLFSEDEELQAIFARIQQNGIEMMIQDLNEAKAAGHIRKDIRTEEYLYFINNLQTLISDEHFLAMYPSIKEASVSLINFFFYGISNHN